MERKSGRKGALAVQTPLLEARDLTVHFGGQTAVNRVSLKVYEQEFKSIIGPNGAGKTTLFNLLSGQLKPVAGTILYKGEDITGLSPYMRTRKGIGRSFQLTNVFPNLTVFENVRLAVQSQMGIRYEMRKVFTQYREVLDKTWEVLRLVLLEDEADQLAKNLSHGDQRKLEIACILALDAELLLLDEPTDGMSVEEVPAILEVIEKIKEEHNKTILLIEHKMDLILHLSDTVTVLYNGEFLAEGTPEEIMENETVQSAYLGGLYVGNLA